VGYLGSNNACTETGGYGAGSDSNAGTCASPWATLTYAAAHIASSDTVYVVPGTYTENHATQHCWYINQKGTWRGDGVFGSVIVHADSAASRVAYVSNNANGSIIDNFVFDAQGAANISNPVLSLAWNNGTVTNCIVKNPRTTGVPRLIDTDSYALTSLILTHNLFDTTNGTNGTNATCVRIGSTTNAEITVNYNIFRSKSPATYMLLIGVDGTDSNSTHLNGAQVIGNLFFGPLYYDIGIKGATIHGMEVGDNANATIAKNYFNGVPYGIVLKTPALTYTTGGVFENILINCGVGTAQAGIYAKGTQNVRVFNNVIWSDPAIFNSSTLFAGIEADVNATGQFATGLNIKNNIVVGPFFRPVFVGADSSANFSASNNLIFRGDSGTIIAGISGTTKIWSEWIADYDAKGVNSDPLFVLGGSDFHLLPNSPAVRTGTLTGEVGFSGYHTDYFGTIIFNQPYDILNMGVSQALSGSTIRPIGKILKGRLGTDF